MRQRGDHALLERIAGGVIDEVGQCFGVGLRDEPMPRGLERDAQRVGVFHDAVVHQRHPGVAVAVRVRVALGGNPVGGPARVRDPARAEHRLALQMLGEPLHAPRELDDRHAGAVLDRNAGGVVAAILQPAETVHEYGRGLAPPHVSDDATHVTGEQFKFEATISRRRRAPRRRAAREPFTGQDAHRQARLSQPDAIIQPTALPDGDASGLCRALRVDPDITASTPIFVTTAGPTTRQQVSDALRAGANSVWADPIDTEEFLLRLDGQLQAKFDADRAREEGLLDHQTGLYNTQGLERRARELASHVDRRGAALACVVLAPDATTDVDATIESLGRIVRSVGRGSDTIGRVGRRELAVLAPYTDAPAPLRLAQRLLETAAELASGDAPGLRAGYDVGRGFRPSLGGPPELGRPARSAPAALFADGGAERIRSS